MHAARAMAAVAVVTMASGCIPQVPHGPRVEPGTRYSLTASVTHVPSLQGEEVVAGPSLFAGGSHGWAGDDVAASVGVQLPVLALPFVLLANEELREFWRILMADVYVQPKRAPAGGIDLGVGSMFSPGIAMPYVQAGTTADGGIYTTQAAAFTFASFDRTVYWLPSVSFRSVRPDGRRIVDYFAHAVIGWHRPEFGEPRRDWALGVGVQIEFVRPR